MAIHLDGPRVSPASGELARQLVIFVHGYGADGNDLIGLSHSLAPALPDAAFLSPNAPEPLQGGYFGGRQWFPLHSYTEAERWQGVNIAGPALKTFIEREAANYKLSLSNIALVGFSQGTMMSLHTGLRLSDSLAAIVGFSGHLVGADKLKTEIQTKPPVLLIHGAEDPVIPVEAINAARNALEEAGVHVQWHIRPGLAHSIDPVGIDLAGQFLRNAFKIA